MKIKHVASNDREQTFAVTISNKRYLFPYAKLAIPPSQENPVKTVFADSELGNEAFTYELESGEQGTVHLDHVLEYNQDPRYLRDLLLYKLTVTAQERVKQSSFSKRELIRRMKTSPTQFYRLLDQTNYQKTIDQLMKLLHVLDCEVDLVVKPKPVLETV